ncbi:MAG TPA: phage baseplate assembly protein V [Myxococcota bacterium]|nr:phage baseplate assembly protein V [Myxococcota bacterium]
MMQDAPLVLFATVKDTKDPDSLGRIQVTLATHDASLDLPWIRVLQPIASKQSGYFWLPEVGDEVAVLRGMGNHADGMVVIGAVYSGKNKPKNPDADGKNNLKQILTRTGNEITIDDKSGDEKITIQTGDKKLSMVFDKKTGEITITGDKKVTVKVTEKAIVDAKDVEIKASNNVDIKAATNVTIKGSSKVAIQGGQVEIKGDSTVKVEAGAPLTLKGATVNIN